MRDEIKQAVATESGLAVVAAWRTVAEGMKLGPLECEVAMIHLEGFSIVMEANTIDKACESRGLKFDNQVRASIAGLMAAIQIQEQCARDAGVDLNAPGM